jgi:excinuclease UvrABC nuclease subunit
MATYKLEFEGFYRDAIKASLPTYSGLYFVYRGLRLKNEKGFYHCKLNELIYIGQAKNVNERLNEQRDDYLIWQKSLESDEILYFSVCKVDEDALDDVEAACIYHAKPRFNTVNTQSYNGEPIHILSKGNIVSFDKDFSVP